MKVYGISNSPTRFDVNSQGGQCFTALQGGAGSFSLVSGVAGLITNTAAGINCAAHNGVATTYEKSINPTSRIRFASVDFNVTADNPDDGAELRLLDLMTFQPRREAAFDANRRAVIGFNAVLTTVGTVGVVIGTWYRLVLAINAATGLAAWRIAVRDTDVQFAAGTVAAAPLSSAALNRVQVYFDSSGLTCPVQYERIILL